jgi:hypothetical protein
MVRTPASLHNENSDNNEDDNDDPDNENKVHRERGGSGGDNDIILPDFGNRGASRGGCLQRHRKITTVIIAVSRVLYRRVCPVTKFLEPCDCSGAC